MFSKEDLDFYQGLNLYERSYELVKNLFKEKLDKGNSNYLDHLEHVSQDFKDE